MALTAQQLQELKASITTAEKLAVELDLDIKKATAAGLDVSQHRKDLADLQKNIAALKLHYLGK